MKKLVIAIVCSAVLSGLAVLAWAALSQDAWTAAAGDSILSIPACAFAEAVDDYDFTRYFELYFDTGLFGNFYAPVNLPKGSIIKKIILICYDDNGSENIYLTLYRINQSGNPEQIVFAKSSGTGTVYRTFSQRLTSKEYVNPWKYSYYLEVHFEGTHTDGYKFSQAKVVYTPPSP